MNLRMNLAETIASGLKRRSITQCSRWSTMYRVMGSPFPGPWSFLHHPWLKEMHDCMAPLMVGQKSAQMGFTEVALNKTFYFIDLKGWSVLYVLPSATPDASRFSTTRFDPALELSPHLNSLFSDVKNVSLKRAGSAALYVVGSRSRSQLKSVPTAFVVCDEVEEMDQKNIALIPERQSGQNETQMYMLSTPSIDGMGINKYFKDTTQDHFFFVCPHCMRWTELTFPDCLVITSDDPTSKAIMRSHLICKECKHPLDHRTKAQWLSVDNTEWVSQYPDKIARGFYINQLYSMVDKCHPFELAQKFLKSLSNPGDELEFWNSNMGLTYELENARVTQKQLNSCKKGYIKFDKPPNNKLITMGVDVGKRIHYEIDQWDFDGSVRTSDLNLMAKAKLLQEGSVSSFNELDLLMNKYNIYYCVIDKNPDARMTYEFAQRWQGRVKRCEYNQGVRGSQINIKPDTAEDAENTISVDRTSWLDLALGRMQNGNIDLPSNLSLEYEKHMQTQVRTIRKDKLGNPVGIWVKNENDADHLAHARCYSEIALKLAASVARNEDIGGIL